MDLIYWGLGETFYAAKRKIDIDQDIFGNDKIIAYTDNNPDFWGKSYDGKLVLAPQNITTISFDKVVITSIYVNQIKKQLINELGVNLDKIWTFNEYCILKYIKNIYRKKYDGWNEKKICFDTSKLIIYTAITGNYDNLKDPLFVDPSITYVCFTNNKKLKSDIWNIEYINDNSSDNRELARIIKLQPHKYFRDFETSVWIDGKFQIKNNLKEYIKKYEKTTPVLCFPHFERNCIYSEAAACIYSKRGNKKAIINQICQYYMQNYPFDNGLYETGCMVRAHNSDLCQKIMSDWKHELDKYSLRDQISFPYVCWKNSFEPDICDLFINENVWIQFIWHNRYY